MKLNILSRLRKKLIDLGFLPNFVAQLPKKIRRINTVLPRVMASG